MQPIQGGLTFSKWSRRCHLATRTTSSWGRPRSPTPRSTRTSRRWRWPSANPLGGVAPLSVQFTGSGSSDPEFTTLTYSWDFGDGGNSTQADPAHTYSNPGTYTATLTVTDQRNGVATATVHSDRDSDRPVRQRPHRSGRGLRRRRLLHGRLPVRGCGRGLPPGGQRLRRGGDLLGLQRHLPGRRSGRFRHPVPAGRGRVRRGRDLHRLEPGLPDGRLRRYQHSVPAAREPLRRGGDLHRDRRLVPGRCQGRRTARAAAMATPATASRPARAAPAPPGRRWSATTAIRAPTTPAIPPAAASS